MEDVKIENVTTALTPKKGASGFKKFMRWFMFILVLCFAAFVYWKYFYTYSDGLQGGKMQKISKKGNVFKTWEGYLLISSSSDGVSGIITPKEWPFTVTNDSIAHVLENFAEKNVKLRYHQKNGTLPWRGDTEYIIYEVSLVQ
jgi:hypothetical protein